MDASRTLLLSSSVLLILSGPASPAGAAGFDAHRLWMVQGDQAGAGFGSAVASGDVNGDGFRDMIVGAPVHNGAAAPHTGKVFVYYGSAGGLASSPSWTAEGEPPAFDQGRFWPYFGSQLASADVNGDGIDDVVIGAYGYDSAEAADTFFFGAGRIYVYYGSKQGLPSTPSFVADGRGYDLGLTTGLGYTLATGDFNGDGFADVAASNWAYYYGGAVVYYGSPSGLSESRSWRFLQGGAHFLGASVSVGDFDGDGYDDLVLTSHGQWELPYDLPWAAFVYRGSPDGLPAVPDPPAAPPAAFTFPDWVTAASLGDVDGDGFDDILALELGHDDPSDAPTYALYRGSPSGPVRSKELAASLDDPVPVLYPIGDLNGDGFADTIAVEQRTFLVHFGSASGLNPLSDGMGRTPAGPFAPAGDVDGDGIGDLIVGDASSERADLYRGGTDWSFSVTADLAVQQVPYADASGSELTVTNAGPDTVRLRLFDPVPPTWSGASWFCYHLPFGGPPSGATARCLHLPVSTGDLDSVITIAPGGGIDYEFVGGVLSLPVVSAASLVLPDWVVDPDLSNNRTTLVMGPPLQLLFLDNFESGDLSAWSSHSGAGLSVLPKASLQGDYGLEVTAPLLGKAVVRDDSPADERDYHAHFLFDPQGFGRRKAVPIARRSHPVVLFSAQAEGSGVPRFEIRLERKAGTLTLLARASLDDGTVRESAGVAITDARHLIEVAWRRSSGSPANDGLLQLRLDGVDAAFLSSLDNDAGGGIDYVELGLATAGRPLPGGARRTVFLDAFESWRPK